MVFKNGWNNHALELIMLIRYKIEMRTYIYRHIYYVWVVKLTQEKNLVTLIVKDITWCDTDTITQFSIF